MNPSELVKGCKEDWNNGNWYKCGENQVYCPFCKARMEQALFMLNNYCFCESDVYKISNDIEILEKALNIHSPQVGSPASIENHCPDGGDLNNQEVKE